MALNTMIQMAPITIHEQTLIVNLTNKLDSI